MSDYTKTTNFAAKDSLPSGNSGKIVKGTEIDTEFNNIQTAVATKLNTNNGALTGTTTFQTLSDGTIAITAFVDEDNMSSNSATLVPTQQSVKAYVDAQITAEDLDFQADSGGALSIDLDSETLTFTGGTGVDTSGSGNAVTFAIDSTVATLTGSQTLTNKTLTSPVLNTGVSGSAVLDEDNMASDSATHLATQQSIKAYVDSNVTAQDLDVTDGSASIDIDLDSESLGILGGTGIDSTASGTGVTLAIDSTVATLAGTQTLTNKTLTSPTLNTPTIGTSFTIGSATITEAELEILDGATVTTAELNVLDGITSTTAELNILDGVTSTAAELNILDGVTSTSAELNILDGVTSTTAELNILDGVTSSTAELNILDGVTSTAAELNILDGVTSTTAELNILDGVTATTTELNYVDGVTSAIQTQLDAKAALAGANFTGNVDVAGTLTTDAFSIEDATSPTLTLNDTTSANQKTTLSHTAGASVLTTGDNGVFGSFKIAAFNGTSTINRLLVADNGDVSLYEDGGSTAKLVWDSSAEALEFADNAKATFGAGDDLQIYHDASNSYLEDAGTGNLILKTGAGAIQLLGGSDVMLNAAKDGAVTLYHDNAAKLATTATGIDVTGTVTADGLTVDTNTLVVDATNNLVGIGNSSPSSYSSSARQLVVGSGSGSNGITITSATNGSSAILFADGTSSGQQYDCFISANHANSSLLFGTGATGGTDMTLDQSGNLGIGESNPAAYGTFVVKGTATQLALNASSGKARVGFFENGTGRFYLDTLNGSDGLAFVDADGSSERLRIDESGGIRAGTGARFLAASTGVSTPDYSFAADGSMGMYRSPGALCFATGSTERARFDSSANFLVAKTSHSLSTAGHTIGSDGYVYHTRSGDIMWLNRLGGHGTCITFMKDDAGVGSISTNANSLPSDRNFKTNINDLALGLDFVTSLKPVTYNYKIDEEGDPVMSGLIAQDVEESLNAAGVAKNSMTMLQHKPLDDEKQSDYQIDYLKLVPVLINAIKEQQTTITDLTTRLTALENN